MKFNTYFEKEDRSNGGTPRWRIRGSGVRTFPEDAKLVKVVVDNLERNGVAVKRYELSSPMNVSSSHIKANFKDGGLDALASKSWGGERGAWVTGALAIEYLCNLLGVVPPERSNDECAVPEKHLISSEPKLERTGPHLYNPCATCVHRRSKRTGVTTGVEWCDLGSESFPKRCNLFQISG